MAKVEINIHDYYYISEIFVIPDHQRKGIAFKLLKRIEAEVISLHRFKDIGLLSIERESNHPLKSADYRSSDGLWSNSLFLKTNIKIPFEWRTLQPDQTTKIVENPMNFWVKSLLS